MTTIARADVEEAALDWLTAMDRQAHLESGNARFTAFAAGERGGGGSIHGN